MRRFFLKSMKRCLVLILMTVSIQALQAQSLKDSLLLYLPFTGDAKDASGNGNNGTVHNAVLTKDRSNSLNSAYDFDGISSYIEIPASASLSKIYTSKEVTIAAWINIRKWYNNWNVFAVFEQYDPVTDYGSVLLEANWASGGILFESGYNTNNIGCDYTWDFNKWHHLAISFSRITDTAKFYVDGKLVGSKFYNQNFSPDKINPYVIGRSLSGPDEYSDGSIDELRIYNRALKESELLNMPPITDAVGPQVSFGNIAASVRSGILQVDFSSQFEKNSDHFIIEDSVVGKTFTEIGTVKCENYNSTIPVSYTFNLPINKLGLAGLGLLPILAFIGFRRKNNLLMVAVLLGMALIFSCRKSSSGELPPANTEKTIYVRVVHVALDGTKTYSNVIETKIKQ